MNGTRGASQDLERARAEAHGHAPETREAEEAISEHIRLRAVVVYEIIQREGSAELARSAVALWWSGLAAGLAIGLSVLSEALIAAHLPDTEWKPLVENFGYCVGFIIVIMARQQLFTENTLTPVLPVILRWKWGWLLALLRLWGVVLLANLVGCFIFATFLAWSGVLPAHVAAAVVEIGQHLTEQEPLDLMLRGIVAGWLVAALVWMLPSAEGSELLVITLMTYIIALGDFSHVIAGSAETFYLFVTGEIGLAKTVFGFLLPTLVGNIIGGTVLFALLSYAQVREEIAEVNRAVRAPNRERRSSLGMGG